MAGIYIHIPFCKRTCSYCDFYKSTIISFFPEYIATIKKELKIRKNYLRGESVETIYIGGGTPSLLSIDQLQILFEAIYSNYLVTNGCEITFEANPDDLSYEYLKSILSNTPINRLSIGIQSFNDDILVFLNRRHNSQKAFESVLNAKSIGFKNISVDLIYGIPGLTIKSWEEDIKKSFIAEHISAYHLSIEKGTKLSRLFSKGQLEIPNEEQSAKQFYILNELAIANGFKHYEISNLAKDGFFSKHNSNYWLQVKYAGFGPSAHSYNIESRQWNVSDIRKYIKAINSGELYFEIEKLNVFDRFNEYIMLSLRTIFGADEKRILDDFGNDLLTYFIKSVKDFIKGGYIIKKGSIYNLTLKGWLISDYIIRNLIIAKDPMA